MSKSMSADREIERIAEWERRVHAVQSELDRAEDSGDHGWVAACRRALQELYDERESAEMAAGTRREAEAIGRRRR